MDKPRTPRFGDIFAGHNDAAQRAEFARVVWEQTLSDTQLRTKAQAAIIQRYVLLRTEFEFYYAQATHQGPTKVGPNGGIHFSMEFAALLKIADQLRKDEEALLLSPKAAGEKPPVRPKTRRPTPADEFLGSTH